MTTGMRFSLLTLSALLFAATLAIAQEAGWLGVVIGEGGNPGVSIRSVEPGSPAGSAGITSGDRIVEFDGMRVIGARQFTRLVAETPLNRTVPIKLLRNGEDLRLEVTLKSRPRESDRFRFVIPDDLTNLGERIRDSIPDIHVVTRVAPLGIRVDPMTAQLRDYFGAPADAGVLIVTVDAASPASDAKLLSGDVIVGVDGKPVTSPRDLIRAVETEPESLTITILRNRIEREMRIELSAATY